VPWSLPWPHRSSREAAQTAGAASGASAGEVAEAGPAAASPDFERDSARTEIPVLPRLLAPVSLTARSTEFTSGLAGTRGLPPILRPPVIGHSVDGPVGVVRGLATPLDAAASGRRNVVAGVAGGDTRPGPAGSGTAEVAAPDVSGHAPEFGPIRRLAAVDPASRERAAGYSELDRATMPALVSLRPAEDGDSSAGSSPRVAEFAPAIRREPRPATPADEPNRNSATPPPVPMSMGRARRMGLGAPLSAMPTTSRPVPGLERPDPTALGGRTPAVAGAVPGAVPPGLPARPAVASRPFAGGAPRSLPALHAHREGTAVAGERAEEGRAAGRSAPPVASTPARTVAGVGSGQSLDAGRQPGPASVQRSPIGSADRDVVRTLPAAGATTGSASLGLFAGTDPGKGSAAHFAAHSPALATPHATPPRHSSGFSWASPARESHAGSGSLPASAAKSAPTVQRSVSTAVLDAPPATSPIADDRPVHPAVTVSRAVDLSGLSVSPGAGAAAGTAAGSAAASGSTGAATQALPEEQLDQLAGQVYGRIRDRLSNDLLHERERAGLLADL
jgi:hypothetical protein